MTADSLTPLSHSVMPINATYLHGAGAIKPHIVVISFILWNGSLIFFLKGQINRRCDKNRNKGE